ncbi:hypothetical protein A3I99_04775 [Candidatus Kaiserbacteria bacterium RIFCSPLOWO2_02_FULL_45_11b]|uniref:Uncharacterized protein n=1 Tax=Candidatus Kaiserbacteria bacterium RIFCSPLOWO2_12_FULL_45_26 TaxID=1798525 RepID=A0A1F6FGU3_9BACT|nr:MAG: hypothetical protein A2929_00430 [Candidatus Kaiserbacteria bacterium RIFCSPLOWO2_01_FULL_45_25]OGG81491.1 MAG: hypothetical protein A3I99_04775 [Candidatus Kaiserbacteria bacterium RIFCSPLOWO2_02_FULL_45_11b]OGG85080.1 MAG: hypothetical protein A3G90_03400 [Candidatus Kaiserbacteria bacterium RIFCSPLOWO2_12_FULL_45_26]
MRHEHQVIRRQPMGRFGVRFDVTVANITKNLDGSESFCVEWYVETEGEVSPPQVLIVPYAETPFEKTQPTQAVSIANMVLQTVNIREVEENVLSLTMFDDSPNIPKTSVFWHTKHRSFNPKAWAKAA